jgi:hypothetical protein
MNDSLKSLWTSSYCTNKGWIVVSSHCGHSVSWCIHVHVCTPSASSSVLCMGPSTCVCTDVVVPSLSGIHFLMPIILVYVTCWSINSCLCRQGLGQGVPHPLDLDIGWVPCVGNGILHAYLPCYSHSPFIHLLIHAMHSSIDLGSGWQDRGSGAGAL